MPAKKAAIDAAANFVGAALFPRVAHRLRWPQRLGPRGLLLYIAVRTALIFAIREWAFRAIERRTNATTALRIELGREPTDAEITTYLTTRLNR